MSNSSNCLIPAHLKNEFVQKMYSVYVYKSTHDLLVTKAIFEKMDISGGSLEYGLIAIKRILNERMNENK